MDGSSTSILLLFAITQIHAQVKDVYQKKTGAMPPDYIKDLANPNRGKYYDSLIKLQPKVMAQTPNSLFSFCSMDNID